MIRVASVFGGSLNKLRVFVLEKKQQNNTFTYVPFLAHFCEVVYSDHLIDLLKPVGADIHGTYCHI
jgi:hypothetical protein